MPPALNLQTYNGLVAALSFPLLSFCGAAGLEYVSVPDEDIRTKEKETRGENTLPLSRSLQTDTEIYVMETQRYQAWPETVGPPGSSDG